MYRNTLFVFFLTVWLSRSDAALAATTVDDQTALMSPAAIQQIDARNAMLQSATGSSIIVVLVRGSNGETSSEAAAEADRFTDQKYGAVVWVATDERQTDVVFVGQARKWVPLQQQDYLRKELARKITFCCPSDSLPGLVNQLASAMESGSKNPPDPRNYVHDELGLLTNSQTETITSREQQLEAATGKGIAVVLIPEPQTTSKPGLVALSIAETLNVNGQIAAVVWATKGVNTISFDMLRVPGQADSIADSTADNINASFQADMQSGQLGDAIVAAIDRTAAALQATSTAMPSAAPGENLEATGPQLEPSGTPSGTPRPGRTPDAGTVALIIIMVALILIIATMTLRRRAR